MQVFETFLDGMCAFCFDPDRAKQLHEMGQKYIALVYGQEQEYTNSMLWDEWIEMEAADRPSGYIGFGRHLRVDYDDPEHKLMDDRRFNEILDEAFSDSDNWSIGNLGLV